LSADPREKVFVVDFGAQYAQLIARRVRECKVYSEIVPYDISPGEIKSRGASALIFSGGPSSVYQDGAPVPDPGIFSLGLPVLGICYGHQLLARELGGRVEPTGIREYGKTSLKIMIASPPTIPYFGFPASSTPSRRLVSLVCLLKT